MNEGKQKDLTALQQLTGMIYAGAPVASAETEKIKTRVLCCALAADMILKDSEKMAGDFYKAIEEKEKAEKKAADEKAKKAAAEKKKLQESLKARGK